MFFCRIKIINTYIAKHFLYRFLILTTVLLSLVYVITFSEMLRKIDDDTTLSIGDIFYLSFSQLPPIIDKIFPFLILLSSLWSVFGLLKTSELVILKVSSVSLWRISKIYFSVAFILSIIYVLMIMPLLAYMHNDYRKWENSHYQTVKNIRKKIILPNSQEVIFFTAEEMNIHNNKIKNIHIVFMNKEHLLEKIYFSEQAFYERKSKLVVFDTLKIFKTDNLTIDQKQVISNFNLPINFNSTHILNSDKQSIVSIYLYPDLIASQKEQKLSTKNMYVLFYSLLFLPLTCGIYSFISVASVPHLSRSFKTIRNIIIALSAGLLFYILDNWIMVIASNGTLPLFIAILTFKIPVILLCIWTIFNKEYGFVHSK